LVPLVLALSIRQKLKQTTDLEQSALNEIFRELSPEKEAEDQSEKADELRRPVETKRRERES